eukprot:g56285.t1
MSDISSSQQSVSGSASNAVATWNTVPAILIEMQPRQVEPPSQVFNSLFQAKATTAVAVATNQSDVASAESKPEMKVDHLLLQLPCFSAPVVVTLPVGENIQRKEELASFIGVGDAFLSLEEGSVFNNRITIKVAFSDPGNESLFRPGPSNQPSSRCAWEYDVLSGKLVSGEAGGNRIIFLEELRLTPQIFKLAAPPVNIGATLVLLHHRFEAFTPTASPSIAAAAVAFGDGTQSRQHKADTEYS